MEGSSGFQMPTALFVGSDDRLLARLAETLFNASPPRGWRATSAGILPSDTEDSKLAPFLLEQGLRSPSNPPVQLDPGLLSFMRVVVWISEDEPGELPPYLLPKIDARWKVGSGDLHAARDQILSLLSPVKELCAERTPRMFG